MAGGVIFFEGFEQHTNRPVFDQAGLDLGQHDWSYYWGKGSLGGIPQYTDGYNGGTALKIAHSVSSGTHLQAVGGSNHGTLATTEYRVGQWFRVNYDGTNDPSFHLPFWGMNFGNDASIYIFDYPTGGAGITEFKVARMGVGLFNEGDIAEILATTSGSVTLAEGTWHYLEFYYKYNNPNSVIQVKLDDSIIMQYNGAVGGAAPTLTPGIHLGAHGNHGNVSWDNIWLSGGDSPVGNQPWALAVAVSGGNYVGAASNYQGFLTIGGTLYKATAIDTDEFTDNALNPGDGNQAWKVHYFVYTVNPATLAPWSSTNEPSVTNFGVCFNNTSGASGMKMTAISLQELITNVGKPVVSVIKPGQNASYNGFWNKTNQALSLSGHVKDIPPDPQLTPTVPPTDPLDDQYLTTSITGCIQFDRLTNVQPFYGIGLTFAEEFDESYRDWQSVVPGGTDFISFFISGYKIHGQGDKKFESNYVTVNYEPTLAGSAFLQGVWDYANDPATGRWGVTQQVHRDNDTRYDHKSTRLKVRGHGRALSFRVTSQSGHPFRLNGWTVFITGNQMV